MAKRKNYSPVRGGSRNSNGGWKLLSVVQLLVSVALAIVIVCAVGSEGFTKKDVKTWFKKEEQPLPDKDKDGAEVALLMSEITAYSLDDTAITNAVSEDNKGNAYVTYAENTASCVISVKVLDELGRSPEDLQDVTWSLSDGNAGLTMSAVGTQATFYASDNGFNKQITATCTSNLNESVSKTFTFDCAYKQYTVGAFNGVHNLQCNYDDAGNQWFVVPASDRHANLFLKTLTPNTDSGTVQDEFMNAEVRITLTDNLKQKLIATGLFNEAEFNYYYQPFDNNTYYWNDYSFQGATKTYMEMRYNLTGKTGDGQWTNVFNDTILNNTSTGYNDCDLEVELTVKYKYGGTRVFRYRIDYVTSASDMETDSNGNIIL